MFVKRVVVKGIGSGIGLASEAIADRKERKAREAGRSPSPNPLAAPTSREDRSRSPNPLARKDSSSSSSSGEDDEVAWTLDEAGRDVTSPPTYEESANDSPVDEATIATRFIQSHNLTADAAFQQRQPLPAPVILPQRRPKNKERGFVRAYAPVLNECSGIDQATFLNFLETFDQASKTSPIFDVINIAAFAVGFIPNPIAMGVTLAVQVANGTAKEVQSRYRRNTFLNLINEQLFMPRGLYCMIMTYKPDASPVMGIDVTASDQALAKVLSEPDSELKSKLKNLRLTSGVSKGELSLPDSAPLIYPALDAVMTDAQKASKIKTSTAFMTDYFDRRAQAVYSATNPTSKLAVPPPEKQFASRYSDPNHPANSGTIWGLVTGGRYDPIAEKRARKASRRAARRGVVLTEEEIQNAKMGRALKEERGGRRKPRGPIGLVKKVLKKDVLYLTIVNLPSESEMREIRQELERSKSK
jgi:hypothetical protein